MDNKLTGSVGELTDFNSPDIEVRKEALIRVVKNLKEKKLGGFIYTDREYRSLYFGFNANPVGDFIRL